MRAKLPSRPPSGASRKAGLRFKRIAFTVATVLSLCLPMMVWGEVHFRHLAAGERPWRIEAHQLRNIHEIPGNTVVRSALPGLSYVGVPGLKTPDGQTMNGWGYHDDELVTPKPKGVYRIAIVGDSMTTGAAVDNSETFSNRLERMLNEHGNGKAYDVVNLGVPGYQALQSYSTMKYIALPLLEPDLVIYAFYANDLGDTDLNFHRFNSRYRPLCLDEERIGAGAGPGPSRWAKTKFFLRTRSALVAELGFRAEILRYEKVLPVVDSIRHSVPRGDLGEWFDDFLLLTRFLYPYYPDCQDPAFTDEIMKGMAALAKEHAVRFMILHIPHTEGVGCDLCDHGAKEFIDEFAAENPAVPVYAPYEYIRTAVLKAGWNPSELAVSKVDRHWSRKGHELIAEGLFGYLTTHRELLGH